ncbi:MAG: hypothetical protein ABS938_00355 [Psychrobacillus psychrodurans]
MEEEKIVQISAKLHPKHDAYLIEEIKKIPRRDRSRTYREALIEYFKRKNADIK